MTPPTILGGGMMILGVTLVILLPRLEQRVERLIAEEKAVWRVEEEKFDIARIELHKLHAGGIDPTIYMPIIDYAVGKSDKVPTFAHSETYDGEIINQGIDAAIWIRRYFDRPYKPFWKLVLGI